MQLQELRDGLGRPSPPAALGRYAKPVDRLSREHDSAARTLGTVGQMDEAEVDARLRRKRQRRKRCERRWRGPAYRHRHVQPGRGARADDGIRELIKGYRMLRNSVYGNV